MEITDAEIIENTSNWINSVVVGCNFCPFAAKVMLKKSVRYIVIRNDENRAELTALRDEFEFLDLNDETETTFIIFPESYSDFNSYLDLTERAEKFLEKEDYEGVYQLASFHPEYCFAGSDDSDAANYTNRSPYPMLHILREDSITKALENFPDPDSIPEKNIDFARKKGLVFMKQLLAAAMK